MPEGTSKRRRKTAPANKTVRADGTYEAVRYSQGAIERICTRIAQGESWTHIAGTPGMPSYGALFIWRAKYPEFAEMLAQARETAAELRADMAVMAAEAATKDDLAVARLKVSAYQKFAANPAIRSRGERKPKVRGGETPSDAPRRFIVEVRRWTKVTLPDGGVILREVFPEGHEAGEP